MNSRGSGKRRDGGLLEAERSVGRTGKGQKVEV